MRSMSLLSVIHGAVAALAIPAALAAQGQIIPRPCVPPPPCRDGRCIAVPVMPPCPGGNPIMRTASNVKVVMADRVLRYEVSETFVNRGPGLGEADYIFPLPSGAAFEDFQLSINGELVSGETMDAGNARRVYEEIVRRKRDPALVEWMGTGLLRARVFPIEPNEEKHIVVRFQTVAPREGSALRIDYVRGTQSATMPIGLPGPLVREGDRAANPNEESSNTFTLTYPADATYGTPYSPTHTLRMNDRAGRRTVTASGDGREVTILLPLRRADAAAITVLSNRPDSGDGFALITISPPAAPARHTPRDLTFVVDVSGSMRGEKLEQAKAAGRALLATLGANDRFRIIDFSDDVRSFRDGFAVATEANVREARRYLDDLHADGSTNISGALDAALQQPSAQGRLPLLVFVTDGEPTVGERNPDAIAALAARRRGETRIFSVGVSADVNAALIEQLAVEGQGTAQFVRAGESVERAVNLLGARLSTPVLTGVRITAEGVRLRQMHPSMPIDLFAGQDLVVLARYDGSGDARLRVEGQDANGTVSWSTTARFPQRERANPFVPRLWANQRLGWLAAEKRKHGGTPELDAEIKSLGEQYGIPTEFTSYFVAEPGMQTNGVLDVSTRKDAPRQSSDSHLLRALEFRAMPAPAAASPQAAQEARFEKAKQSAAQRDAKSLAQVDSIAQAAAPQPMRQVGARQFSQQGTTWIDQRYALSPSQKVVKIKAYSPLYFDLVNKLAGLSDVLVLGEQIVVSGRMVAIQIGPDGMEKMTDRELADLVKAW